jgi:glycosyltransferase involved in cell wall biosynthesis
MHVIQIASGFPTTPLNYSSGVVQVIYHLSKELVQRGHDVTILSPAALSFCSGGGKKTPTLSAPFILEGIKIYYFPHSFCYYPFYVMPKLIPFFKKNIDAFDIAHVHDIRSFQSIIMHHYATQEGVPYVSQLHGSYLEPINGNKPKWLLDHLFSRRILADSRRVIALTETETEYYKRCGIAEERIDRIGNGIEFDKYQAAESGAFRKRFGISPDERVVLYVGRITRSKGIDLLVEAFSDLKNRFETVKLVIIGPDYGYASALRDKVNRLNISDSTLFTGPVDEYDKINAYADADVFVTPSFTGFPLTFLESCACGTPIVTTHDGDAIDWIDGYVGYVTGYSKKELTEAITTILCDDQTRERFKANCRKLAQRFAWPSIVDKIEETYRRAAGN